MKRAVAILAAVVAIAAASEPAYAAGLNGIWTGYYGYGDARPVVKFQARLGSDGASVSGATIENNTFGDSSALFLTANLSGVIKSDGSVDFIKTYDGTGGQAHSVAYTGVYDRAAGCVSGRWSLGDASGAFKMCANPRSL